MGDNQCPTQTDRSQNQSRGRSEKNGSNSTGATRENEVNCYVVY